VAHPIVSVTICAYNSLRYIDETLQSVFAQTFQDFEIIVVDDGSTDGTADHIEREYPDERLKLIRQPNQTLRVARPVAVAHGAGEFIAFLDHDDVWLPEKLERQVAAARGSPQAALIFSDCFIIDEAGRTLARLSDQYDLGAIDLTATRGHLELLRRGCFVAYATAFARTSAVRAVGGFSRTYQYVSDYDLWLRLARRHQLKCITDPLAKYRVHETQFTQRHSDITLSEHTGLLWPIYRSASYPPVVRSAIAGMLFGQHRVAFGLLLKQRRFAAAARAAAGVYRYPAHLRDYCRYRLATTALGPPVRRVKRSYRSAIGVKTRAAPDRPPLTSNAHVWIDGSPLAGAQTGYFNLVSELIRRVARPESASSGVHVFANAAGRAALLERLGGDGASIRFHPIGWRALHWSQIHGLLVCWPAQLTGMLVAVAAVALALWVAHPLAVTSAILLVAVYFAAILDELRVRIADASGRSRQSYTARVVRLLWRRLPGPRRRAPAPNTVEVIVWRGRFRWRDSHRIAIVQDVTTRIHPGLHTEGNVAEFNEYLGYSERHAHTIATVSEHSRKDIIDGVAVCPDSVIVMPMPVHPQYHEPHFSRGYVASHGITTPYVLSVATIEPRKNLRRLVRAFHLLKDEDAARDHVLVLVGPAGWDAGFHAFLVESDAYPRVRMPGFVPLEHLPSLYHFASAVICPSVYEGFGIPVMEAMCSSGVVLASRVSSLPEVLGDDGLLFEPYDTEDIARVLLHALELPASAAASYRKRCRQRAEAHLARLAQEHLLPAPRLASVIAVS
jgi:glycosyltransferase involved in cell wall biosynthesis/GT2 family glycosyltransferase